MSLPRPLKTIPVALRQVRISDQIVNYVQQVIKVGQLPPGAMLPSENELARVLGVSRPAVREATSTLAGKGVISTATGRAPTVLSLSESPFSTLVNHALVTGQVSTTQVLNVRRGLEAQAAALAALERTPEDVDSLQAIVQAMRSAHGDIEAFSALDVDFHRTLAQATRNPLMTAVMSAMADVALESSRNGLRQVCSDAEWDAVVRIHQDIAEAVVAGDVERARVCMASHFDSALGRLERCQRKSINSQPLQPLDANSSPHP